MAVDYLAMGPRLSADAKMLFQNRAAVEFVYLNPHKFPRARMTDAKFDRAMSESDAAILALSGDDLLFGMAMMSGHVGWDRERYCPAPMTEG